MANLDALDEQLDALQSEHQPEGGWLGSLAIVLDGINEAGKHDEADKGRIARMVDRFLRLPATWRRRPALTATRFRSATRSA